MGTKNYSRWITTLHHLQKKLNANPRSPEDRDIFWGGVLGVGKEANCIIVSSAAIHTKKTHHFLALLGVVFNNRITIIILRFHYRGFSWKRI